MLRRNGGKSELTRVNQALASKKTCRFGERVNLLPKAPEYAAVMLSATSADKKSATYGATLVPPSATKMSISVRFYTSPCMMSKNCQMSATPLFIGLTE
jgi:hypothetical protein